MNPAPSEKMTVGQLAAEWRERLRQGARPEMADYLARYPELADEIRELFPAVVMIENLKEDALDLSGALTAGDIAREGPKLERLGDYHILREVGRGGMGIVYEAEQESLGRRVALKVLPAHALLDPRHHKRFQREARAVARLHHTNIVPVYGVGEEQGVHYYVMQFIQGLGLDAVLAELKRLRQSKSSPTATSPATSPLPAEDPAVILSAADVARSLFTGAASVPQRPPSDLPGTQAEKPSEDRPHLGQSTIADTKEDGAASLQSPSATTVSSSSEIHLPGQGDAQALSESGRHYWQSVARIGIQVADALEYASSQGVMHRDIKPSNLLLDTQGNVWVTDFGLAKAVAEGDDLTHTGDVVGTLRYMAPERFEGRADIRSDLYSLGLTLYELLVLQPAYAEKNRSKLIHQVTHGEPPAPRKVSPTIPRDLETIVLKAIARDPGHRYQKGAELAEDLRRFVEDRPIQARRVSVRERLWRWCRRNPALAATTGVAAIALVAATILSIVYGVAQADFAARQSRSNEDLRQEQQRTQAALDQSNRLAQKLDAALLDSQKHAAQAAVERAQSLFDQDQPYRGLLWLANGLELAPADAPNLQRVLRTNLASVQSRIPVLKTVWSPHGPGQSSLVAFSRDGESAATVTHLQRFTESEIRAWDVATGKPLMEPISSKGGVGALALSPDGKLILTVGEGKYPQAVAQLWDVATGKRFSEPLDVPAATFCAIFSPEGHRFFLGGGSPAFPGDKGLARLWETATGKPLTPLLEHSGGHFSSAAFSPDGKIVITGLRTFSPVGKGSVRLWESTTGKPLTEPLSVEGVVSALAFSPDGKTFVIGTADYSARKGTVQVWDVAEAEAVSEAITLPAPVHAVAFSPDGRLLLTSSGDYKAEVQLWDLGASKPVGPAIPHPGVVSAATFTPDGRHIVTGGYLQPVRVWELPADSLRRPLLPHVGLVKAVGYSSDGQILLTATAGQMVAWHAETGKKLYSSATAPKVTLAAVFSPDGKKVLTGHPNEAQLWDAVNGQKLGPPLPHKGYVEAAAFSPDGTKILIGTRNLTDAKGAVRLWDAVTGKPLTEPIDLATEVKRVVFSPTGETWAALSYSYESNKSEVRFWDLAGKPFAEPLDFSGEVISLVISPDGQTFATAGRDHIAQLWNLAKGKPRGLPLEHPGPVLAVAFSADGKTLVTGGGDRAARLWDVATGRPLAFPFLHPAPVTAVAFSPDGQSVLTAADRIARLWQMPAPASGEIKPLVQGIQKNTGFAFTSAGAMQALDASAWQKRLASVPPPETATIPWHLREGIKCVERGHWAAVHWHLDRHLQNQPDDWLAWVLRAGASARQNRLKQAGQDLDKALTAGSPEAVLPWLRTFAGESEAKKEWATAIWFVDVLLDNEPEKSGALYGWRARLHQKQNRLDEAIADLDRAIDLGPDTVNLRKERGELLLRRGQFEKAIPDFARQAEANPSQPAIHLHALLLLHKGDRGEYAKICAREVKRNSKPAANTCNSLAWMWAISPEPPADPLEPVKLMEIALKADPGNLHYQNTLGAVLYRAKQYDKAVETLKGVIKARPDDFLRVWDWVFLAMAHHRLDQPREAQKALQVVSQMIDEETKKARKDQAGPPAGRTWNEWLELLILRREAEALVQGSKQETKKTR